MGDLKRGLRGGVEGEARGVVGRLKGGLKVGDLKGGLKGGGGLRWRNLGFKVKGWLPIVGEMLPSSVKCPPSSGSLPFFTNNGISGIENSTALCIICDHPKSVYRNFIFTSSCACSFTVGLLVCFTCLSQTQLRTRDPLPVIPVQFSRRYVNRKVRGENRSVESEWKESAERERLESREKKVERKRYEEWRGES